MSSSIEDCGDGRIYYQLVREQNGAGVPITSGYDWQALAMLKLQMNAQAPEGVEYKLVKVREHTSPLTVLEDE